jgi:hypothetical protein
MSNAIISLFGDFRKLGAPLMALFFSVGVFVLPMVRPF